MTIEIDDSGTGDILGPWYIGMRRVETNEIIFKQVSSSELTLNYVQEGLEELNHEKTEIIQ